MKTIRVCYTNKKRILAIGCPTSIPNLLESGEIIVHNWYYNKPRELESFLLQNPNSENDLLKAFSYWVIQKVMGFAEQQNNYGLLKRELIKFNKKLFKSLRAIAGRIGLQIKKFIYPKK